MEGKEIGIGAAIAKKMGQDVIPPAREEHTSAKSFLMSPIRFQLFKVASETPGKCLRAMARELGKGSYTTKIHLDKLEARGILASFIEHGKRHYYVPSILSEQQCRLIYPLAEPERVKAYNATKGGPKGIMILSEDAKLSPQMALYHLEPLIEKGLVTKNKKKYSTTALAKEVKQQIETKSSTSAENVLDILKSENLSPSKIRKFKNTLGVEVTLGAQRKRVTIALVPQISP